MVSMSQDEFWTYIEHYGEYSDSIPSFNRLPEAMLDPWELPKLAAFHKLMWRDIGVHNDDDLRGIVAPLAGTGGDDTWECHGGWLIAHGRRFYEAVMRHPHVAAGGVKNHRQGNWFSCDAGSANASRPTSIGRVSREVFPG
jgi:hypothetical protein